MEQPNFSAPQEEPKKDRVADKMRRIIGMSTLAAAAAVTGAPSIAEAQVNSNNTYRDVAPRGPTLVTSEEIRKEFLQRIDINQSAQSFLSRSNLTIDIFEKRGKIMACFAQGGRAVSTLCYTEDVKRASLSFDEKEGTLLTSIILKSGETEDAILEPVMSNLGNVIEFKEK